MQTPSYLNKWMFRKISQEITKYTQNEIRNKDAENLIEIALNNQITNIKKHIIKEN